MYQTNAVLHSEPLHPKGSLLRTLKESNLRPFFAFWSLGSLFIAIDTMFILTNVLFYFSEASGRDEPQCGEGGGNILHPPTRGVHRHATGTDTHTLGLPQTLIIVIFDTLQIGTFHPPL